MARGAGWELKRQRLPEGRGRKGEGADGCFDFALAIVDGGGQSVVGEGAEPRESVRTSVVSSSVRARRPPSETNVARATCRAVVLSCL